MENNIDDFLCPNCGAIMKADHRYCSNCGQIRYKSRFTVSSILLSFVESFFSFEKGALHTIKKLTYQPAQLTKHYLSGATVRYYTPLKFVFITATVSTIIMMSSGLYDETMASQMEKQINEVGKESAEKLKAFQSFIRDYISLLSLLLLPIISLLSLALLRKPKLNFAEHLIYNTYAMGQANIYQILFFVILWIFPSIPHDYNTVTFFTLIVY